MHLQIQDSAKQKIVDLITNSKHFVRLRIAIEGGGCSGFLYQFSFDRQHNEDDYVLEITLEDGSVYSAIVVDSITAQYLQGAKLNYVADLQGARFVVSNPNAKTTCSCGSSFAV